MRIAHRFAALAVPVALLVAGCGGSEGKDKDAEQEGQNAGIACDGLLKPADAAAALPADVPGFAGATYFEVQSQGVTKRYFARTEGDDLVATRDKLKSDFETAGLKILGTDQEAGTEAEFEFETKAGTEGSVQVVHLCKDNLRIRWRVGPK